MNKEEIKIKVYYMLDKNNNKILDIESMMDDFEVKIKGLLKSGDYIESK